MPVTPLSERVNLKLKRKQENYSITVCNIV